MEKKQIKKILKDLYKIDPSLRAYQKELKGIVLEIIKSRPEIVINQRFKKELYREIMEKAYSLSKKKPALPTGKKGFWQVIFAKKLSYGLVGALAVILLLAGIGFLAGKAGYLSFNIGDFYQKTGFQKTALGEKASLSL